MNETILPQEKTDEDRRTRQRRDNKTKMEADVVELGSSQTVIFLRFVVPMIFRWTGVTPL